VTGIRTRRLAWWTTVIVLIAAMLSALGIGLWQAVEGRQIEQAQDAAARESVLEVAKSTTIAMLSYKPDTVEAQLNGALSLLTGDFRESFAELTSDTVIPGAREKRITAVAAVPAASVVSLSRDRATLLVFINQTVTVGTAEPSDTASSVRMDLQKINDKWLVAEFDPV
jgi:Mce-associated membrane protein